MFSPGSEILAYLRRVVDKYQLSQYIKLRHELTRAQYDEATGKWHITIRRPSESSPDGFEEIEDWADFVFNGVGILHRWAWPEIPGLDDFKGIKVHSADWNLGGATWEDDVKDWGDKKVAVIGLVRARIFVITEITIK